eukprot:174635-Rhodomonas_salina.1
MNVCVNNPNADIRPGVLGESLWADSQPLNFACLLNSMLASHNLSAVFVATNSGSDADREALRAAVRGKVVFLQVSQLRRHIEIKCETPHACCCVYLVLHLTSGRMRQDLGALDGPSWEKEIEAMVVEMFVCADAHVFLSSGPAYWESSTISRLIVR